MKKYGSLRLCEEESSEAAAKEIAKQEVEKEYIFPPTDLLKKPVRNNNAFSENEYKATAIKLQQTLHNFVSVLRVTNDQLRSFCYQI